MSGELEGEFHLFPNRPRTNSGSSTREHSGAYNWNIREELQQLWLNKGPPHTPSPNTLLSPGQLADKLIPLLEGGPPNNVTNSMTAFNIINNYVGMVLLSLHFCFARSGWLALPLLALLTAFGAWTGELIIESYRSICAEGVQVPSYAQIGERCLGTFGKWLVIISSVIETYMCILCLLIIIWSNASLLLPGIELRWIILGACLLSFPTNWLRDFSLLSFLSAFGLACVLLIVAVVVYNVAALPPGGSHATQVLAQWDGVAMASSIMLAGLTGHVSLPPMYAEMRTPSSFKKVLYLSFLLLFLIYAIVGGCGYVLYGSSASVLITHDMSKAFGMGHHTMPGTSASLGQLLVNLVLGGITFKIFCSVRENQALTPTVALPALCADTL